MRKVFKRGIAGFMIAGMLMLGIGMSFGGNVRAADEEFDGLFKSFDELKDKNIGIPSGTITDTLMLAKYPDVNIQYYNAVSDAVAAVKTRKVDAYIEDEPVARLAVVENPELTVMDENLAETDYGAAFPKNEKGAALRTEFNEWLKGYRESGELERVKDKWIRGKEEDKVMPDYKSVAGSKGTLVLVTTSQSAPMSYIKENDVVGADIEMAARFCMAADYKLEIVTVSFEGLIPYVQSGKGDMGLSCISITEERKESVYFSDSYYRAGLKAVVLRKSAGEVSFFAKMGDDFQKTFIKEGRWKLFGQGILTTLLISVLSIIFGTALGFGVFMACRRGSKVANAIFGICTKIIQGMPMVVLLMVLFYIIFGSVAIDGRFVAVIGFTLTFGAAVFSMVRTGVGAVDIGQYEAAYALGYSNRRTFFRVIFPQALPLIIPSYKSEIVSLIKATAVVGYIAVQDLTKMGDIVRSRTYEPYFSLISITIIYFILEALLAFAVSRIEININPKRRKRESILKGVKTDD